MPPDNAQYLVARLTELGGWGDVVSTLRRLQETKHPATEEYDHLCYAIALCEVAEQRR